MRGGATVVLLLTIISLLISSLLLISCPPPHPPQDSPVPFRVDQLPMSDNVMGIWSSLVRLAGISGGVGPVATSAPAIHTHPFSLTMKPKPVAKEETHTGVCVCVSCDNDEYIECHVTVMYRSCDI